MRRLFITLLAISTLGLGGALAQVTAEPFDQEVDIEPGYWAGVSLGYPFGANFHFGMEDLISQGIDLRATAAVGFGGTFGIGADVLFDLPVDTGTTPLDIYAGGGAHVGFGGEDSGFMIGILAGAEYRLVDAGLPEGGVFFEFGPNIGFGDNDGVGVAAKLGFNYHF